MLAGLIADFGPTLRTGRAQSAAYPFTRPRSEGVWVLDHDVPMDLVGPLAQRQVTGRFEPSSRDALRADPALARLQLPGRWCCRTSRTTSRAGRAAGVGLDPDAVLRRPGRRAGRPRRVRRGGTGPAWRLAGTAASDGRCTYCGYDGRLAGDAGLDAAHVRWFLLGGQDELGSVRNFV